VTQGRPIVYLSVSAVFHYLGPAIAVLLFSRVDVWGVAWLRIASAAVVFAAWQRPWRAAMRPAVILLGVVLAAMNTVFYLAIARLPLATVGAIEFLGVVTLAAAGARTVRNLLALVLAVGGVVVLTDLSLAGSTLGFVLAFANCALFMLYITFGHRIATTGPGGVHQLGAAMLVAALVATPFGIAAAAPAFAHPVWLLIGCAVGISSSVIPYVTDQLAMARLRRSTFALMLCVLPAWATVIGAVVLGQIPTARDLAGIALVITGVAVHRQREED
jgi:inner membrane transporter RhtA